jgi:potassium/hydrogen antiporter
MDGGLLALGGAVLLIAVAAAYAATRLNVPILVAFLGLGMLLGSDGPGGVEFDDADLARTIGVLGLAVILFEGGLNTDARLLRPVAVPAALLATVGVAITATVTGLAATWLFDLSTTGGLVLGAVVASTDAAAVFATLRTTRVRRRLAALLEAESGLNDPMAVALTVGLIAWITTPGYGVPDLALLLARELIPGLLLGIAFGLASKALFDRLPGDLAPFAPATALALAAVTFGTAQALHASGFLAVYVAGVLLARTRSHALPQVVAFLEGGAFIVQIVLFVVLGLLVFPSHLDSVALSGLALVAVLVFAARPLAVVTSTLGQGFEARERLLLGWAGLRGAVPIVLATFALSEGLAESEVIFDAVFFVVVSSVVVQGVTLAPLARRLGLARPGGAHAGPPIEGRAVRPYGGDVVEVEVEEGDALAGTLVRDLPLPRSALVTVILRDGDAIPPRGSTRIEPGDRLSVLARAETLEETRAALLGGHAPAGGERRP